MTYKVPQLGGGRAGVCSQCSVLTSRFLLLAVGNPGQVLRGEMTCGGETLDLELDSLGTNHTSTFGI